MRSSRRTRKCLRTPPRRRRRRALARLRRARTRKIRSPRRNGTSTVSRTPRRALFHRVWTARSNLPSVCADEAYVFVLDTGVRVTHEDFRPPERVGSGWNFVGCGDEVDDQSGHGTHTAGTAVGATSGVAKCATLHPVQILDGEGKGKSSDVLSALDWVADRDVGAGARKVVSMSVGGPRSAAIDAAVREMVAMGVFVVAAAGNEGRDAAAVSPAGEPAAVTVGSSTSCPSSGDGGGRCASDAVSGSATTVESWMSTRRVRRFGRVENERRARTGSAADVHGVSARRRRRVALPRKISGGDAGGCRASDRCHGHAGDVGE